MIGIPDKTELSKPRLDFTKKEITDQILPLKNDTMIGTICATKHSFSANCKDWWKQLTETDKVNILSGVRDYQQGLDMTSEDFWKRFSNG